MSATVDERISDELEALQAILMHDVIVKKVNDVPEMIETVVHPSTGNNVEQQFVCITLEVRLTPGYPDISPEITLRNPRGLDDKVINSIHTQIKQRLVDYIGQPVLFEVIELIRENLTKSNLPSGQCVICLFKFTEGDAFIKTQCYHYFHSYCFANHLISGQRCSEEKDDKVPSWQPIESPKFQTCPVCRCPVTYDLETLRAASPPAALVAAPPFCLTAEMKELQKKMAAMLARQAAKGGVIGMGDNGPPPLTITSPSDGGSTSQQADKADALAAARPHTSSENAPGSPQAQPVYRGPYRGFNRRGKPGRRDRGGPAAGSR